MPALPAIQKSLLTLSAHCKLLFLMLSATGKRDVQISHVPDTCECFPFFFFSPHNQHRRLSPIIMLHFHTSRVVFKAQL